MDHPPFTPFILPFTPVSQPPQIRNPNPNPNPNLIPPTADLPTMISLLKDLTAFAEGTLQSVSDLFSSSSSSNFGELCRCPFDPRHRMPPEFLFRHSLICPSAPGAALLDLGFLETLRYPGSLKSDSQLQTENSFVQPLAESDAELCFSLDQELGHLGSNFFYRDYPGVVTTPEPDASRRTFTLPSILSAECANFISHHKGGNWSSEEGKIRIFPSELWALRNEVKGWRDYPTFYSYTVLQVTSCLPGVIKGCLKKWVISNSPCYGILIDAEMRDHIFLLLKLCLKAIGREARCSLELLLSKDGLLDPRSLNFECPRLVGSLTWLASQLSVLYGETNGKFFTVEMLKESLLRTGSSSLLTMLGKDKVRKDAIISGEVCEFPNSESIGDSELEKPLEGSSSCQVFVSQVAAAVAALHERFMLEERIKVLRFGQPFSKYQLLSEYSYASTRGCEERGKRPNYRAVLEHDGLHWQRAHNQDQGKAKTREELLAEERDYKRRRMSYRGKKVKRTPTQVIRDIIEEHMDEIKQAGGIGCNLKVNADTSVCPLECSSQSEITADIHVSQRSSNDPSERRNESSVYKKPLYAEYTIKPTKHGDVCRSDRSIKSRDLRNSHQNLRYGHSEHWEDRKRSKHESEKNYEYRTPLSHRSYAQLNEQYANLKKPDDVEEWKTKYERTDSKSKDHNSRSSLTLKSSKEEYNFLSETRSKDRGRTSDSRRSESVTQNAFEDRYDPSVSYDGYGTSYDGVSVGADEFLTPNDARYHDDPSTKRRYQDHHKI